MTGVAWTAIGLVAATLLGMLWYLGSKLDGPSSRIDAIGASLGSRIEAG